MIDSPEFLAKVTKWQEASGNAKAWAEQEKTLRNELIAMAYPDQSPGTKYAPLPEGWRLKVTFKLDTKLDEPALPAVLERLREKNCAVVDALVNYKPALVSAVVKTLSAEDQVILADALIVKPAQPSLELVPPKA